MQAKLMGSKRFWPLFWTQFLGAFNDNFFKNALVILITFQGVDSGLLPAEQMVAIAGAVFIAPFFLFSATAGQLADKMDKALLIRLAKNVEIGVMVAGGIGFITQSVPLLFTVLFVMGLQSTLFGPVKYSILPQHLEDEELVAGNALVEMGTYMAILGGTIAGGVLIGLAGGPYIMAAGVLCVALAGRGISQFVPEAPSASPDLKVSLDPIMPTWRLLKLVHKDRSIYLSVLGISWFWAFGAMFMSLFLPYTRDVLHGNEHIATLFTALFSVGIGVGSMVCEKLSRERLELGLVPIGSFGMSLFTFDLWLIGEPWAAAAEPLGIAGFLAHPTAWRIAIDLLLLAVFGGFLIVPLYTLVQLRAEDDERARVIAGNNVINAGFMVGGSLVLAGLFAAGIDAHTVFILLSGFNLLVAIYMYTRVPEFVLRFLAWVLSIPIYRLHVEGHERIPDEGPVVLVANHVSFIDWFVLVAAIKRPARFVMYKGFYNKPVISFLFKQARAIPIAGRSEDPALMERAFDRISEELQDGQVVFIFPEGKLSSDGEIAEFKKGIEHIIKRDPVPVVPVAINGLWGSFFSRKDGSAMSRPSGRFWSRVWVTMGEPVAPTDVTAAGLREKVSALWEPRSESSP